MKLEGFEKLDIVVQEEDQALVGLEITFSDLGDQGRLFLSNILTSTIEIQIITDELKRSGLAKILQQLNFQGNKEVSYDYKASLSEFNIEFEG